MTTAVAESSTKESFKTDQDAHRSTAELCVVALSISAGHQLENETDHIETSRWHTLS